MSGNFLSGLKVGRCTLYSPFPPGECAKRLGEKMDSGFMPFGKWDIVGRASPSRLKARIRAGGRNNFLIVMYARLEADGQGTLFTCRFSVPLYLKIITAFWLVAALALAAFINIFPLAMTFGPRFAHATEEPITRISSLLFLAVTAAIALQAFSYNAYQQGQLTNFVCNTVNAVERISPFS